MRYSNKVSHAKSGWFTQGDQSCLVLSPLKAARLQRDGLVPILDKITQISMPTPRRQGTCQCKDFAGMSALFPKTVSLFAESAFGNDGWNSYCIYKINEVEVNL